MKYHFNFLHILSRAFANRCGQKNTHRAAHAIAAACAPGAKGPGAAACALGAKGPIPPADMILFAAIQCIRVFCINTNR